MRHRLLIPDSLMSRAKRLAESEHTSLNQFFVTAIAEKLASLDTEHLLSECAAKADVAAFKRVLKKAQEKSAAHEDDKIES